MATITQLEKSRVEIRASVPAADFAGYRDRAIAGLGKKVKIDGFREGNVPAKVLESKLGAAAILDEMAQLAIMDAYPKLLTDNKIDAIGLPQIQITKIADNNDLEFTITTAVMPTVKLGDYKKSAQESNESATDVAVTDEELEASIKELRQMRAHYLMHEHGVEHHEHDHTKLSDEALPALDDEFVKTLGKFDSVDDFKTKLRENLAKEKQQREIEKKRIATMDAIIAGSTIDVPDMMIDFELDKMMQQFAYDISMTGQTITEYLQKIEKSEGDLKKEWRENAEKRAKMQIILDEIARTEKLAPSDDEIQAETQKILDMYQDQKDISEDRVRAYVTQMITNAKVFEWLDNVK